MSMVIIRIYNTIENTEYIITCVGNGNPDESNEITE